MVSWLEALPSMQLGKAARDWLGVFAVCSYTLIQTFSEFLKGFCLSHLHNSITTSIMRELGNFHC